MSEPIAPVSTDKDVAAVDATNEAAGGIAIKGFSASGNGVRGESRGSRGVVGVSAKFDGVYGFSSEHVGVVGVSGQSGEGTDPATPGVHGVFGKCHNQNGAGVFGTNEAEGGFGVQGVNEKGDGIVGSGKRGVVGMGVDGFGVGVVAQSRGVALEARGGQFAAVLHGKVIVHGDLEVKGLMSAKEVTGQVFSGSIDLLRRILELEARVARLE
jgi:hypothetical protein